MKRSLLIVGLLTGLISSAQSPAEYIPHHLTPAYRETGTEPIYLDLNERMKDLNVQGLSIVTYVDGELHWAMLEGFQNTEKSIPLSRESLFQAASISKPLAGIAVLRLVQEGKLDLDVDVNEYLTSWTLPSSEYTEVEKVTLRRLLTHTAGVTVHGFPGYANGTEMASSIEVLNGEGNTPKIEVDTIPGSMWRYSGGGYVIIQTVIEDVTGMSFSAYMDGYILPELGMNNSTFSQPLKEVYESRASLAYHGNGMVYEGGWHNYPEVAPAGLWTTSEDLAKYINFVHEVHTGKRESEFLSKTLIDEMLTPMDEKSMWGLGPALEYQGDTLRMQHGGKNAGFSNVFLAYPQYGAAAVVMTNSDNGRILMREVMRSISAQYGWEAAEQELVERHSFSDEEKEMIAGSYEMENGQGYAIELIWEGEYIRITDGQPATDELILPVSENRFIDMADGDELEFTNGLEAGTFTWNGYYVFHRK